MKPLDALKALTPDAAAAISRRNFMKGSGALIVGFHFSFPSLGHVEKAGTGYQLVPVAWNPVI